ncbi:Glutaredoxin [Arthrobacter sp. ov407]|uniref:glutaredoxin family protein n=1 Tax=Arthrobacter sp. ov407 TaxID=1761748 RepID=UPI000886E265|nr:glutaredoxin family protein [Arthrobacter sp. ov407]SDL45050.1 Glutaredoxin [Arthrobacter sp. ov407]
MSPGDRWPVPVWEPGRLTCIVGASLKHRAVTIYTKPAGCFGCTKTRQKFTDAGIAFTGVNVTTNQAAFEYITEELGYSQVPVVI